MTRRIAPLALTTARLVLRILIILNQLFGAAIFALLMATILSADWTFAALGVAPSDISQMALGLRAIPMLGLVAVALNDLVLRRLFAIVETVRGNDPFVAINAARLQAIAWAMLSLELISLVIGVIAEAISTPTTPLQLDAGFSVSGWLAVLLTFVLARVFAEGARMREDLEGTV